MQDQVLLVQGRQEESSLFSSVGWPCALSLCQAVLGLLVLVHLTETVPRKDSVCEELWGFV